MEQFWVALLAVGVTIFSSGIDGSVLHHQVVGGPGYIQWIPHELFYSNVHLPHDLSQLHGLRIDEALGLSANEQGLVDEGFKFPENGQKQSSSVFDEPLAIVENKQGQSRPLVDQTLAVIENGQRQSPPVSDEALRILENIQGISPPLVDQALGVSENEQGQSRPLVGQTLEVPENGQRQSRPLVDEALTVHENRQGQSPSLINEALTVPENLQGISAAPADETLPRNGEELSSTPVAETSSEINRNKSITQEQLFKQIFRQNSRSSEGSNASEEGITSTGIEIILPSSIQTKIHKSPTVVDLLVPQTMSEGLTSQSSVPQTPIAPEQEEPWHPKVISKNSVGKITINAEEGKLQMQAALLTGGDDLNVTVGDISNFGGESVPVIIPELPLSGTIKDSKSQIITNLNVNLNINRDGKGSVINSTSVAKLTTPIKTDHKKCD